MLNGKCESQPWVATACRGILKDFKEGQSQRDIAILVADRMLDFFIPLTLPYKPEILVKYDRMSDKEKLMFDREEPAWREKHKINEWERGCRHVILENRSNIHWLTEWANILTDDSQRRDKLLNKLAEFENVPQELNKRVREVKSIFSGEVVNQGWEEELQ